MSTDSPGPSPTAPGPATRADQTGSNATGSDTSMLPVRTIEDGPVPKHAQLRAILEEMSTTALSPGDMLPGERTLEEFYGVSRITVRRAIGDLVASGRLRRVRGKGTFVAPNPLVSRMALASFSQEMAAQGVSAASRILLSERAIAPPEVVNFFGCEPHEPQIHLRRLRLGDGQAYALDDAWYNVAIAPDLLENDVYNSVYAILEENYDAPVTTADQTVTAVDSDISTASHLDVEPGVALLHVIRRSVTGTRPVEWCSSVYRSDRYRLHSTISREYPDNQ
ncbi:HTH-type transcriptional repressor DasR [Corynebacterium guangdongense]|uniref:GntR family transcriptional regulator n=2 Tax=Corynebacterium guangdongense TaxID=1783348 RepID=A0ABU1ZZV7_9CORY|nr:GntR family transcriptional regulator [Corynebacterium guangdongense]WJZ19027.1 HTH-type transcriptional repressor DasR [Corynebacterium guangdongense]